MHSTLTVHPFNAVLTDITSEVEGFFVAKKSASTAIRALQGNNFAARSRGA